MRAKLAILVAAVLAVAVAIGFYIGFLTGGPTPYRPPAASGAAGRTVDLTLQTVAAIGPKLSPNETWVSYLVRENGVWHRSTVWTLPANTLVHVTVYNFDGKSGLRNPFLAQARGVVGGSFAIDGKPTSTIAPDDASHTFAIPGMGVIVPIQGVDDNAPHQCDFAPCPMSNAHHTITFAFRTGKKGHYRWQCFVPCAAGFVYGFGGPMQTVGYMDGYVDVV
ncbi:MAG TPA: hypothetical protein VFU90_08840 [Candidatus Tumulicola sp.]|nr:hypothetical protein [Candidatus Tumulicola sp.]